MQVEDLYKVFLRHPIVVTDTRNIITDSLYFALHGENYNGNEFALQAIEKGCAFSVTDDSNINGDKIIHVPDVLLTLQDLAQYHRHKSSSVILAITGTNGKTTTKELISSVLSSQKKIICTQGNLNNHIGVPLTLLTIKKDTEIAVIEMGANHPGEIDFLCNIADPDIGLITNVGVAHIEGFGSFQGVINTKTELFRYLHKRNRKAFVNAGSKHLVPFANKDNDIFYSGDEDNFVTGKLHGGGINISVVWSCCQGAEQIVGTQLSGDYNLENIIAAVAVGKHFGITDENINKSISGYKPSNKRSQYCKTEKNEILNDAYNANPTSTRAAVENFYRISKDKKVIILGDMFELGQESTTEHNKILDLITDLGFTDVYLAGKDYSLFRNDYPFNFFEDTLSLAAYIKNNPVKDSFILLKGSRGMKMETILEYL